MEAIEVTRTMAGEGSTGSGVLLAGRYRLGEQLGSGGMGVVVHAVDERTGRAVAVKRVLPHAKCSPELTQRFARETAALSALSHPHIVRLIDARLGDDPFMVTERLEGETLGRAVREGGPMSPEQVTKLAEQALSALAAAHDAGLVHRDVKPDNLFLVGGRDAAPFVKVIDFGIARTTESRLTAAGQRLGTRAYMAPEQALGSPVDGRTDVFSLAAVLYFALTGEKPFARGEAADVASLRPLSTLRPDVCPTLAAILHRGLELRPRDRFGSASEMRAAIVAWRRADATLTRTVFATPISSQAAEDDKGATMITVGVANAVREAIAAEGARGSSPAPSNASAPRARRRRTREAIIAWATPVLGLGAVVLWSTILVLLLHRDGATTSSDGRAAAAKTSPPKPPVAAATSALTSASARATSSARAPEDMTVKEVVALRRAELAAAVDGGDPSAIASASRRLAAALDAVPPDQQAEHRDAIANAGRQLATTGRCALATELIDLGTARGAAEVRTYPRCAPMPSRRRQHPDLIFGRL